MENPSEQIKHPDQPRGRAIQVCDSEQAAIDLVKEFWRDLGHAKDVGAKQEKDWKDELTFGDRTLIVPGILPQHRGKWLVLFRGNNQPLSKEAMVWLKGKGLI